MNTIIIKQNEFGSFDIAAASNEAVRVILVEDDRCNESNIKVEGAECIAWDVVTDHDAAKVDAILSTYKAV